MTSKKAHFKALAGCCHDFNGWVKKSLSVSQESCVYLIHFHDQIQVVWVQFWKVWALLLEILIFPTF